MAVRYLLIFVLAYLIGLAVSKIAEHWIGGKSKKEKEEKDRIIQEGVDKRRAEELYRKSIEEADRMEREEDERMILLYGSDEDKETLRKKKFDMEKAKRSEGMAEAEAQAKKRYTKKYNDTIQENLDGWNFSSSSSSSAFIKMTEIVTTNKKKKKKKSSTVQMSSGGIRVIDGDSDIRMESDGSMRIKDGNTEIVMDAGGMRITRK